MPSLPLLTRFRQVKEQEIGIAPENANFYMIREEGLISLTAHVHQIDGGLKVVSCKFGGDSTHYDFHPTVRRFVEAMKGFGMQPEYERDEDGPNFCFWFDISSREGRAYYMLATGNHGQEIVATVFAEAIGAGILANVKDIDQAIFNLITECGVRAF